MAFQLDYKITVHPPRNDKGRAFCKGTKVKVLPAKAYIDRNHDIVNCLRDVLPASFLIALPHTARESIRSGTWTTIRYARKRGVPIALILPMGQIRWEVHS